MVKLSSFYFLFYSCFAFHYVFLPLLFQHNGLSIIQISIIMSAGMFVSILAQPLWGMVSDRNQTIKRPIIVLASCAFIASFFMFSASSFVYVLIFTCLFMSFMTPIQPLTDMLAVQFAARNGIDYGKMRLWGSLGFAVTAFLLGYITDVFGIESLGTLFAFLMIGVIVYTLTLDDIKVNKVHSKEKINILSITRNRKFLFFLLMVLLIGIPARMNDNLFGLYMNTLGASKTDIGTSFLFSAISEVPMFFIIGYILRKIQPLFLILIGSFLYIIRWIIYSIVHNPDLLLFLPLMQSVTFTFVFVGGLYYIAQFMPKHLMATSQAIFTAVFTGISSIIGSSVGGWILNSFGGPRVYHLSVVLTVIGMGMALYSYRLSTIEHVKKEREVSI